MLLILFRNKDYFTIHLYDLAERQQKKYTHIQTKGVPTPGDRQAVEVAWWAKRRSERRLTAKERD